MKIRKIITKIYEDKNIDDIIRDNGVNRTAKEVGMSHSNLSMYLSGRQPIPEKVYKKIKELIFNI